MKNKLIILVLPMLIFVSHGAINRVKNPRTSQTLVGKYVRPNSKSSLRYFAISPNRANTCATSLFLQPTRAFQPSKNYIPKRDFSLSQIGSRLWKKSRWALLSSEEKKAELLSGLIVSINNNERDTTLSSLISLLKEEKLINESLSNNLNSRPLEIAIELSAPSDINYQKYLITQFLNNDAQLHGNKELELAFRHYNVGALEELLDYSTTDGIFELYTKVRKLLYAQEKELANAYTAKYEIALRRRIKKLRKIEQLLERKTSYFPTEKESELS